MLFVPAVASGADKVRCSKECPPILEEQGIKLSYKPDPIHQFHIHKLVDFRLGNLDFSFTNVSLFMVLIVGFMCILLWLCSSRARLIPTNMQSVAEIAYEFVASTLREATGAEGMRFFPFVFSLFMFVLVANFVGLFPYFYTITAQIMVTFSLAMLVIIILLAYGLFKHGLGFFKLFVPKGIPIAIVPLVTLIEIISFLSRPISLSVRLFANMLAGHITLKVFAGFVGSMLGLGALGVVGSILPLAMTVALTALEFLVAFLQAYVFTVLTCIYLNDALHPAHD